MGKHKTSLYEYKKDTKIDTKSSRTMDDRWIPGLDIRKKKIQK